MTYEQYWHGDVWMVEAFREADKLRQQRMNSEAWLQGMYIYEAFGRMAPVLHAFTKKGAKPQPYLDKPYEIGREQRKSPAEERQIEENERLKSVLYFRNWARAVQKQFGESGK